MCDRSIENVEAQVLSSLASIQKPLNLDELISNVRHAHHETQAVDVKIAALSLVTKGKVALNERWQLTQTPN